MARLLLPNETDSAADLEVSQGRFRQQIASAVAAIRGAMGGGDFNPETGMELAQRLLTSQYVLYVDPVIGRDTYRAGVANSQTNPPLLNQQLECGYSPFAPFKSITRALIETARISILAGQNNDVYDRTVISVANGEHMVDNRKSAGLPPVTPWPDGHEPTGDELAAFNAATAAGLILPRGVSVLGMDLRKSVIRPVYVPPSGGNPSTDRAGIFRTTGGGFFFTFTFKDNPQEQRSHHLVHCFDFCSEADLADYYSKVATAFGITTPAEVMPGETEIVAPYPDAPVPEVDTTVGSSSYVFSCSLRSDYGMCGIYLDGDQVTGFKSMVTAQFTQVSLQKDMNAWELWTNGTWNVPSSYQDYIDSDINNVRLRVGGNYNYKTGSYDVDYRSFGFRVINNAIIQEVSCFVIGHSVHHWTASGGECTITNSNSNFGMTALLSSGFRGIGTTGGAFAQDSNFDVVAVKRPLAIRQDGTNVREIEIGLAQSYDAATGVLTLQTDLSAADGIESVYSLAPGTYLWVDNLSRETGPGAIPGDIQASVALPARGRLTDAPWADTAPREVRVDPASSNINTISNEEIVNNRVYIRRLIDTRQPDEREVALIVQTTARSRRPLGNYVLRLSGATTVESQLDPSNGAQELFLVTSSDITTVPGEVANVPTYKLIVRPGDSAGAFNTSDYYQIGQPVFQAGRIQRAKDTGRFASFDAELFEPSFSMQPDIRGIEFGRAGIAPRIIIDKDLSDDPDSVTLGIVLTADSDVVGQARSSVDYIAVRHLMAALGYTATDIRDILAAQATQDGRWWKPTDPAAPAPAGKINGRGTWKIEFNRPSLIRAFGQAYEWAGQGNYSKAMPKFQTTVLSDQHKVDFFGVSHLGGRVYNTGFNEDGLLIQGNTIRDLASNRDLNTEIAGIGGLAGNQELLERFPNEFEDLIVTRSFTSAGRADFNEVTLNGSIDGSPTWETGVLPVASTTQQGIIRLATADEAKRYVVPDAAITPATLLEALGDAVKGVVNLRISLSATSSYQDVDATSSTLYVHPNNGSEIALYSNALQRWTVVSFSGVQSFSLAPCTNTSANYDVYVYNNGTDLAPVLAVDYAQWPGDRTPPTRTTVSGVLCKSGEINKRLVGVVRPSSPGQSIVRLGGTINASDSANPPRIFVSNFYNQYSASLRYFFGNSWTQVSQNWASPPGYATPPHCGFVLAKPTLVTAFCDIYYNKQDSDTSAASVAYVAPGINSSSGPPNDAFYGEACLTGGLYVCATPSSQWARSLTPGYNQIYYLYRLLTASALINEHPAHGLIVTTQV